MSGEEQVSNQIQSGVQGRIGDLLNEVQSYYNACKYMYPGLEECRDLFSRLDTIKFKAARLRALGDFFAYELNGNKVGVSILSQAQRFCAGEFDVVGLAQRLKKTALAYTQNPQWAEFIKRDENEVTGDISFSTLWDEPDSIDYRYWGDQMRAQACVEWLLRDMLHYLRVSNDYNELLKEHASESDFNLKSFKNLNDKQAEYEKCLKSIEAALDKLNEYIPRYKRVNNKNSVVDAIIQYVTHAQEDGMDIPIMAEELRSLADEYDARGRQCFYALGKNTLACIPELPGENTYLRMFYTHNVRAKDMEEHIKLMTAAYAKQLVVVCGRDGPGYLLKMKDAEAAVQTAAADKLCQNFYIYKAKYPNEFNLNTLLRTLEEQFIGEVVPFSQMQPGTEMYKDFLTDGSLTHVARIRHSEGWMFIPADHGKIYDAKGKLAWPVSPEEIAAEKVAVMEAACAALSHAQPEYDMV